MSSCGNYENNLMKSTTNLMLGTKTWEGMTVEEKEIKLAALLADQEKNLNCFLNNISDDELEQLEEMDLPVGTIEEDKIYLFLLQKQYMKTKKARNAVGAFEMRSTRNKDGASKKRKKTKRKRKRRKSTKKKRKRKRKRTKKKRRRRR